jgi:hypothetical protein
LQLTLEVPPNNTPLAPELLLSLHPDFTLHLSSTSLIGSRAKLQDIPKIEQLIVGRLRGWIVDKLVWPRKWPLRLPHLIANKAAAASEDDYIWVDEADNAPGSFEGARTTTTTTTMTNQDVPEFEEADTDLDQGAGLDLPGLAAGNSSTSASTRPHMSTPFPLSPLYSSTPDLRVTHRPTHILDEGQTIPGHLPRDESLVFDDGDASDFAASGSSGRKDRWAGRPGMPGPYDNIRFRRAVRDGFRSPTSVI